MVAFIHPSQGFMNALVYFQRSNKKEFGQLLVVKGIRNVSRGVAGMISSLSKQTPMPGNLDSTIHSKNEQTDAEPKDNRKDLDTIGEGTRQPMQGANPGEGKESEEGDIEKNEAAQQNHNKDENTPKPQLTQDLSEGSMEFAEFVNNSTNSDDFGGSSTHNDTGPLSGAKKKWSPPIPRLGGQPTLRWAAQEELKWQSSIEFGVNDKFHDSQKKLFEATLEHWRINYLDES
eukprot:CAMPEP_0116837926 /NCGR_PEP_ID=MMETSP0418-20121206/8924_1 /TAXON_ID=1158023 /ORGANISM="Astrosyne radiata, Strain 13vi08-1A" /LENGTH=230 /DNA_ID=CAMNT_0004467863 /DNA_START=350 /DNA_END=1042 /DNA_ORIENTATION=-